VKDINKNYNCTGCGACYNACPAGAITMENDEYGFYKPMINQEKCINCGLCEKKCPLNGYISKNEAQPKVYSLQNKNEEILYKAASGGAFDLFARYIIEQNGIVFGVVWDKNLVACHTKAENLDELEKMYSSKYVQSNTKDTFKLAKIELDKGRWVLYSGTPCQIAGLKLYLNKEYENLLTLDLVCHGVPSPMIFDLYKKEFLAGHDSDEKYININFRSKINGWNPRLTTTTTTTTTTYHTPDKKDKFMNAFLSNLSINTSCANCQFNRLPRIADLSLGDFWGVDEYDRTLNNNKGLSIVLVNNSKGQDLWKNVKSQSRYLEIPLNFVVKYNKNIIGSSTLNPKWHAFWNDIKTSKSLNCCVKKYCKTPLYVIIYRLLPNFIKEIIKYKFLKKEKV
jgi:coenzyme F420-reducing hydrogenase beta subunit